MKQAWSIVEKVGVSSGHRPRHQIEGVIREIRRRCRIEGGRILEFRATLTAMKVDHLRYEGHFLLESYSVSKQKHGLSVELAS